MSLFTTTRQNFMREAMHREAASICAIIKSENEQRKQAAMKLYEEEKSLWQAKSTKEIPWTIKDGIMTVEQQSIFLKHIESFHWSNGSSPEHYFYPHIELIILVTKDGINFRQEPQYYYPKEGEIYFFLTEYKQEFYPTSSVLRVNDNHLIISCAEYKREWLHQQFLAALHA